jgi:hypothetical protein
MLNSCVELLTLKNSKNCGAVMWQDAVYLAATTAH